MATSRFARVAGFVRCGSFGGASLPVGLAGLVAFVTLAGAPEASAHGFGQRYDLPLPLSVWLWGAGASIVLSFVVLAVFLRGSPGEGRSFDLRSVPLFRALSSRPVVGLLRVATAALWLLAIGAGLAGEQDPYRNITPTLVWVVGWVGIAFVSVFFGDIWAVVHPLGTLFRAAESVLRSLRLTSDRAASLGRSWRAGAGIWPAVAMFAVFTWLELVWSSSDSPSALGRLLAIYSILTWIGMGVFGRERWLAHGELFSAAFGVLSRFAPIEVRPSTSSSPSVLRLRAPGVGLLHGLPLSTSQMSFVLLMLATVTFDGFLETQQWIDIADRLSISNAMQPVLATFRGWGFSDDEVLASVGFVSFPAVFVTLALTFAWFTRRAAIAPGGALNEAVPSTAAIAGTLVATLVPIAIAYHLAHYVSMLMISGQYGIPLVSDPFGFGWDLFGTASYRVDIGIIGVRFVWYSAAIAIVAGHVISVALGHVLALRDFATRRAALWSQVPSLVLMVGYTMLSLWILAQPIVE